MKNTYLMLLLVSTLFACEKEALNDSGASAGLPVVQGYLQPGTRPLVRIHQQIPYNSADTTAGPIENLTPLIKVDGTSYALLEVEPGIYAGDGSWNVESGKIYHLVFDYKGLEVKAETSIPAVPENFKASQSSIQFSNSGTFPTSFPDPISLTWNNTDGSYFQVYVENIEANPVALDLFGGGNNGNDRERPQFSTTPVQTNIYELGFQNFQYYGTHQVILFRVSAEYVALTNSNNTQSQNLTAPYTNVVNGLGIFTGVGADTLLVEVND